jgi:predicted metal-dependent peptidase
MSAPDVDVLPPDTARQISESLTRVRLRAPFYATLTLFADYHVTQRIQTAATDGRDIFVNPAFFDGLTPAERDGVLLHEVLHAALLHVTRRTGRDRLLWNIAADIIVNGIIDQLQGFALPKGVIRDDDLRDKTVEEVYYLLTRDGATGFELLMSDLLDAAEGEGEIDADRRAEIEDYWRHAMRQADALDQQMNRQRGDKPAGLRRELGRLDLARLDWRAYLWRYLVQTPTDFGDFDRRFVGQGLYLEGVTGETVRVNVCIDTSGSVTNDLIRLLASELQGILRAYPHLRCELYYADTALYGPYDLTGQSAIPPPIGGGGTDFRPFFAAITKQHDPFHHGLVIYLTDGYGVFPETAPPFDVLWVVTPGGLDLDEFPFGELVRLVD